jgi:hypothetical protein
MKPTSNLIDAQAMAAAYPGRFDAPLQGELDAIVPGNWVKVCRNHERFWIVVKMRTDDLIVGEVNNRLGFNPGLKTVICQPRHIYDIHPKPASGWPFA